MPGIGRGARIVVVAVAALLVGRVTAAAPKVDVLYLKNGDRLTCEIKKLTQGRLTVSTDPLDTVTVYWGEVIAVTSPRSFEVTTASGEWYYGRLDQASPGHVVIAAPGMPTASLALADIIGLTPIGGSAWSRTDGNIAAGFSFTQADLERHWTFNGSATYRSRRFAVGGSLASQVTLREGANSLSRNTLGLNTTRSFDRRWFTIVLGQLQQNEELALDLRSVVGGGLGRELVHSNRRLFSLFSGIVYTRERFTDEPVESSAEAALGGALDFFTSRTDAVTINNTVISYYNVSGRARARIEVQTSCRLEFWKDFYWSVDGVESFDSAPPPDGKKNDASISFAIGWKF